ncbi:MAG: zinc ribbon domain-containing protein [Clostridia bacterium]|nr:zinc ribbon domain-containing protein [Clostridia bacterium]
MFCPSCGAQLPDGSAFCGNCGANFDNSANPNPNPNPNSAPDPAPKQQSPVDKIVSFVRSNLKVVLAAVAVIVVLIIILSACGGKGYEKVAKKYAESMLSFNYKGVNKNSAVNYDKVMKDYVKEYCDDEDVDEDDFFDELEDEMDVKIKKSSDIMPALFKKMKKEVKDEYDSMKFKVEIDDTDKLDEDDIEDKLEYYESAFDSMGLDIDDYVKTKKIKKAYTVELDIEITVKEDGDKDTNETSMTLLVVKTGGGWKVLDLSAMQDIA